MRGIHTENTQVQWHTTIESSRAINAVRQTLQTLSPQYDSLWGPPPPWISPQKKKKTLNKKKGGAFFVEHIHRILIRLFNSTSNSQHCTKIPFCLPIRDNYSPRKSDASYNQNKIEKNNPNKRKRCLKIITKNAENTLKPRGLPLEPHHVTAPPNQKPIVKYIPSLLITPSRKRDKRTTLGANQGW